MTDILLNLSDVITDEESRKVLFTYSDLLKLFDWPKNIHIEIIAGELIKLPIRSLYHHEIAARLNFLMRGYAFNKKLGSIFTTPTEVVLSQQDVILPSLFFVSRQRKEIVDKNRIMGAPEMILEVLENVDDKYAKMKLNLYEKYGVKEVLFVNSKKKIILQYTLKKASSAKVKTYKKPITHVNSDSLEVSSIKGLKIQLEDIFYSNVNL
ncbi:MAG: Uma2 family endonuclease [Candidatus Kariarchaeaceae archaeon]